VSQVVSKSSMPSTRRRGAREHDRLWTHASITPWRDADHSCRGKETDKPPSENPPRRLPPTIKPLKFIEYKSFRQRKLCHGQNLIRDSNTDFRINPDPDVYRIVPKWTSKCSRFILFSAWIISPSIVKNRSMIVWEMLIIFCATTCLVK